MSEPENMPWPLYMDDWRNEAAANARRVRRVCAYVLIGLALGAVLVRLALALSERLG